MRLSTQVKDRLTSQFPSTEFKVKKSRTTIWVDWTDGASYNAVVEVIEALQSELSCDISYWRTQSRQFIQMAYELNKDLNDTVTIRKDGTLAATNGKDLYWYEDFMRNNSFESATEKYEAHQAAKAAKTSQVTEPTEIGTTEEIAPTEETEKPKAKPEYSWLYSEESTGSKMISFELMADAMMTFVEVRHIIDSLASSHETELDFVKLGIKGNEAYVRVFSKQFVSNDLKRDLEEKTCFRKIESRHHYYFCVDYAILVHRSQHGKFDKLFFNTVA